MMEAMKPNVKFLRESGDAGYWQALRYNPSRDHIKAEQRVIRARMPRLLGEASPLTEALKAAAYFGAGALWMFLALGVWVKG